jgi:hypothetical protein
MRLCRLSDRCQLLVALTSVGISDSRYMILRPHVIEKSNTFCHRFALGIFVSDIVDALEICSQIPRRTVGGIPDSSIKNAKR